LIASVIPSTDDRSHSQPTNRDYISFSAINAYRRCPLSYFFRYVVGLPEETLSSNLVFGAAVHRAVEHHFCELLAGSPPPTLDRLLDEYQAEWASREPGHVRYGKDESTDSLNALASRMLAKFQQSEVAQPLGTILAVEERLRGPIIPGLPDLLGIVDLIVESAEELKVIDWKTSRARWSQDQIEDSTEQLLLYSQSISDFAPGKRIRIEFAVLTKTKEVSIDRHSTVALPTQIERTKRMVERVWRAIEAEHFYPVPSPMNCAGCPFREPCRRWPG
jgi:RecB family exonuclease